MAKCTIKMPEDIVKMISNLGERSDEVVGEALKSGAEIVEKSVKNNLQSVIGKGTKYPSRSTGELLRSVGTTPFGIDKNGNANIKIGFAEPRSRGKSNARVATVLEYGKKNQMPKPFMESAKKESANAAKKAIIDAFNNEMKKVKS